MQTCINETIAKVHHRHHDQCDVSACQFLLTGSPAMHRIHRRGTAGTISAWPTQTQKVSILHRAHMHKVKVQQKKYRSHETFVVNHNLV